MRKRRPRREVRIEMEPPYPLTKGGLPDIPAARAASWTRAGILRQLLTGDPVAERLWGRSYAVLDAWSAVLPVRVVNEDLGDYLEDIASRAAQGQRVLVWLRVVTAIIWTGVNAVGYVLKQLGRTKAT